MASSWYVVHTYSGYEHKVKAALEERIRALGNAGPASARSWCRPRRSSSSSRARRRRRRGSSFPGYILVNMELNDETWHIVKSTPKVTGFVGGATDPDSIPPISEAEVREITHQMEEGRGQAEAQGALRAG